jgi:hypothetical protein
MGREKCVCYNLGRRKFTLGLVLHLQHGNQWKNRVLARTVLCYRRESPFCNGGMCYMSVFQIGKVVGMVNMENIFTLKILED